MSDGAIVLCAARAVPNSGHGEAISERLRMRRATTQLRCRRLRLTFCARFWNSFSNVRTEREEKYT